MPVLDHDPFVLGEDTIENGADPSSAFHADDLGPKPVTYYGEGPFDPPSSDEEEELIEKSPAQNGTQRHPQLGLEEDGILRVGQRKRPASLRILIISLATLVGAAVLIGIYAAFSYRGTSYRIRGVRQITMDHIFNGTFSARTQSVLWVPEAGDGVFATSQGGFIKLTDLKTNTTTNLVAYSDLKDEHGHQLIWSSWKLSSDMKLMLAKTDHQKQWRHSSFGNYYIYDFESKVTYPLIPPSHPPKIAYATWSPTGQSIAYVAENDLFVIESPSPHMEPIRVTSNGNASLFHGVPDWVYEEEIFSKDFALWWSPNSAKIAYLKFDETNVDEFTFPVYNPTEDATTVVPYTDFVTMKYPKPGYNNPLVSVHVFELDKYLDAAEAGFDASESVRLSSLELTWAEMQAENNSIIAEAQWIGDETLLVREVNRASDDGSVVLFDLSINSGGDGQVVRKLGTNGEQGDEGWIDAAQSVHPIPTELTWDDLPAYLDVVPTSAGYNHIALFTSSNLSEPIFLTSGDWEVTGGILAVDAKRALVYFQAANPSSIQRHIYSIPLPTSASFKPVEPLALTDISSPGYYEADFSPKVGFLVLSYQGPHVPWQKIIEVDNPEFDYQLTSNPQLNDTLSEYESPIVTQFTIDSDGYELNAMEMRPPKMDDSGRTKYPVLFRVYGGPDSQLINTRFNRDWHDFLVCSLQYIVVIVDGRGTGLKGRLLRNPVKNNLGYYETIDQINAAKIWAAKTYVDPKRIGIWGWSYGGFMSSKVVEAGAGVHSLAMAVAPVTSWRLYDSIYTERYMDLPAVNPEGYVTASISNVTSFNDVDFLLAHGSGDDNVHFANSAHLLDMFTQAEVRSFKFRMFTDSDHNMYRRGALRELYEWMTEFLLEKWGKGGKRRS